MQQKQFRFYRDVHSNTSLPQETRKNSNNLTIYLKQLEKEEQTKSKINRRKKNQRAEQTKKKEEEEKKIQKINEAKSWSLKR